jgi:hypothetical protein
MAVPSGEADRVRLKKSGFVSLGIFLCVGAVYAATGPGRIDIIDGQYRFEVARNLLEHGTLEVRDPYLFGAVPGIGGAYSPYGVSGSIVALPLVAAAAFGGPASVDRQQFFFSLTSAVLGAATAALLFLFYTTLGVALRPALLWTLVAAFATLTYPAATTTFDQTQHGFFVLAACMLAFVAGRRESMALAVAGGVALAVLVNYQETYVILFPTLGLATLAPTGASPDRRRRAFERYIVFIFVGGLGLLLWAALNKFRYGSLLFSGKGQNHPSPFGNPLEGLAALLVSPGKSLFLYSPPTAIALFGVYHLVRRQRWLGLAVVTTCLAYLALISELSFYGGDWCWGPRYFAAILPVLALGFPFATFVRASDRAVVRLIVAAGLIVQLLGIGIDQHRFFYGRSLGPFFWYRSDGFYFKHSALFERPGEILESIRHGVPGEADRFRPGPYENSLTYAIFGGMGHPELPPPVWMRHYSVFWLPRPWPLWMITIPPDRRPIDVDAAGAALFCLALAGLFTIRHGLGSISGPALEPIRG